MAVFHRRLQQKKWTKDELLAVVRQFSKDEIAGYWTWLPLDGGIVEQSVKIFTTLPETVFLQTADCLHLVTALHHGFSEIPTHDAHPIQAAEMLGLRAIQIQ